ASRRRVVLPAELYGRVLQQQRRGPAEGTDSGGAVVVSGHEAARRRVTTIAYNTAAVRTLIACAALALIAGFSGSAGAQPPGSWVVLGEAHVDGTLDHDTIKVNDESRFIAIRIRVENAAVEFHRVVVHFGDGSSTPIHVAA